MLFSYKWLQEYIKQDLPKPDELADTLNTRAFEVEGVEEKENGDYIIDLDIQPNRAHDCFSHFGVSKEISVLTELDLKSIKISELKIEKSFSSELDIEIEDNRALRYVGREIRGIKIEESPEFIKEKLEILGQRSINNIVDIINYVMLEIGQPMHAFDADKVDGKIVVRKAKEGEKLMTLDDKEVVFKGGELLITDDSGPLAIAGIKGGKKAEVDENTKNIILESANFNASAIRKGKNEVGIETDSSKRFERGITQELSLKGIQRATELILENCNSKNNLEISGVIDIYPKPIGVFKVGFSLNELNKKLGIELEKETVENILSKLDFDFITVHNPKKHFEEVLKKTEGRPYVFGASVLNDAPSCFDCSSLIAYAAKESGVAIPRMVIDQYVFSKEIKKDELEPGDLIFSDRHITVDTNHKKFEDKPEIQAMIKPIHTESKEFLRGTEIERGIDHEGVYLGEGKIIHCSRDLGVVIQDLDSSDRFKDIVSYRRIFNEEDDDRYVISVPSERLDIRIKEDVIEEIGRIYGYENIKEKPFDDLMDVENNDQYNYLNNLRSKLINLGFSEIFTSSFVEKGDLETVKPFASDKAYLRTNLTDGLSKALDLNEKNKDLLGLDRIKIFEIGKTFKSSEEKLFISLGISGKKTDSLLEEVIKEVGLDKQNFKYKIQNGITEIEISNLDSDSSSVDMEFPEIKKEKYETFSQYPFITRDIAVWVPGSISEEELLEMIVENSGDLLVNKNTFDKYEKDGKVSYAFRLVFQSSEKTLTDEEINKIMDKITEILNNKEGFEVR